MGVIMPVMVFMILDGMIMVREMNVQMFVIGIVRMQMIVRMRVLVGVLMIVGMRVIVVVGMDVIRVVRMMIVSVGRMIRVMRMIIVSVGRMIMMSVRKILPALLEKIATDRNYGSARDQTQPTIKLFGDQDLGCS